MSKHLLDSACLYRVLDSEREARGLSWSALAAQVGSTPSAFTRISHGQSPNAHLLASLLLWLGWCPELQLLVSVREDSSV